MRVGVNEIRTYAHLKDSYEMEFLLEIEPGRYCKPSPKQILKECVVCGMGAIEDEIHFLGHCEVKEPRLNFIRI